MITEETVRVFKTPDGSKFPTRKLAEKYLSEVESLKVIHFLREELEYFHDSRNEEYHGEDAAKWVIENIELITEMINKART